MPFPKGHVPERPYQKGHTPWNKGKKLGMGACANWCPVGTRKIDNYGYRRIKVSCTGKWSVDWPLLHKVNWEKENGPTPNGLVFWFKNGNKLDCRLCNLEVISKAQRMLKNTLHNKPKEELRLIHQQSGAKHSVSSKLKNQGCKILGTTIHRIR